MEETTQGKPFKSLAQARRCDTLVTSGTITKEVFQRDLAVTDLDSIPWRVGPLKPDDPDQAAQDEYRNVAKALKDAILRAARLKALTDAELAAVADDDDNPDQDAAQQEVHRRTLPDPKPTAATGEAGSAPVEVILVILIIIGLLTAYWWPAHRCMVRGEKMGYPTTFGPFEGCMIKVKTGWYPMQYVAFLPLVNSKE